VQIARTHSYRHAEAIIEKEFPQEWSEILAVISSVQWVPKLPPINRTRNGRVVARLTINQTATNVIFEQAFRDRGWLIHPLIISTSESRLVADFKKGAVQVEVQLGNMARWYTDVFKFLLSYFLCG
jgi:hypothetical protein